MTVIATISVPATDFPFGATFRGLPGARIDLEQLVPIGEQVVPYFWIDCEECRSEREIRETLLDSQVAKGVTVVDTIEDRSLVRIDWSERVDGLLAAIAGHEGTVLEGVGTPDEWTFQLRFPVHEDLSGFYRECVEDDIALELVRVYKPVEDEGTGGRYGLSAAQREALIAALETGYFAVPREISLAELGERLEISDAAVSERLRRGQARLVAATLLATPAGRTDAEEERGP